MLQCNLSYNETVFSLLYFELRHQVEVRVISATFWVWRQTNSVVSCLRETLSWFCVLKLVSLCVCVCVCEWVNSGSASSHFVRNSLASHLLYEDPICNLKNTEFNMYRTQILLDLYGCETWSVPLREERVLSVFQKNKVLRTIFVPKREKVTGTWRKLHNGVLNNLYASPNIIWVI